MYPSHGFLIRLIILFVQYQVCLEVYASCQTLESTPEYCGILFLPPYGILAAPRRFRRTYHSAPASSRNHIFNLREMHDD